MLFANYHDADILSIEKTALGNDLILGMKLSEGSGVYIEFTKVIACCLDDFSQQNIIFDIAIYESSAIPVWLYDDYPVLNDVKTPPYLLTVIRSSVGLNGIILSEGVGERYRENC